MPAAEHGAVRVGLVPVDATNRTAVDAVRVSDVQAGWVTGAAESMAHFDAGTEPGLSPFAITLGGEVVGFVMLRHRTPGEAPLPTADHWVNRFIVDAAHQRRGIGTAALALVLATFARDPRCRLVAISYHVENDAARRLYAACGFIESGMAPWGEMTARRSMV